jgi:methionine sulfoxide reductase catalytic subunit
MLIRPAPDIRPAEITDEALYLNRREWLAAAGLAVGAALTPADVARAASRIRRQGTDDKPTSYEVITTYNNFYEFGTGKDEPADNATGFKPRPWSVTVEGDVKKPGTYDLDQLLKGLPVVERTYRMRCVEAWSMVIPWQGVALGDLVRKLEPGPRAKYVELTTLLDPKRMPGQRSPVLEWPYVEGLRLDEALHPLTLLATGIYGKPLPNQNGAPIRLVVPWKYGFKGGKSIVRIRFVESQPKNTWQVANSREYGFFANVNPTVDHPRWSQAKERRLGEYFKRPTLMFNGYADQVASLYAGMDLRANF